MGDGVYKPFQHPNHMRAVGIGTALAVSLIALAGGVALTVVFATFGFYAAKIVPSVFPRRLWFKRLGYLAGIVGVALILLWALSLLPDLALRGYGLWWPLFALLLAFMASILLEREKVAEADKFRVILALHPRPDGSGWTAKQMEAETDGEVSTEFFERLRNRKMAFASLDGLLVMARVMDFPNELWDRSPEWWESVLAEREAGTDVGDWLREWDCYSPEQAAYELGLKTEDIHRMSELGVLESRLGTDDDLQIRAYSVMEKELLDKGVGSDGLPPYNQDARPGRTGSGRYPKYGIPYLTSQFGN